MAWSTRLQLALLLLAGFSCGDAGITKSVLLVSLGGVRWDSLVHMPNLFHASSDGGQSVRMKTVFPTESLPTAYSLVTGVHPEVHGIVSNRMTDKGRVFDYDSVDSMDPFWWNGAEPVWVTARKAGVETMVLGFPGADVHGFKSSRFVNHSSALPSKERVTITVNWLAKTSILRRRRFAVLSLTNLEQGQQESEQLNHTDSSLGFLFAQLKERKLEKKVDVIIAGTHGIDSRSKPQQVCLNKIVKPSDYEVIDCASGMATLQPVETKEGAVFMALSSPRPEIKAYLKQDVPKRFHFSHNRRIPDIIVLAEPGYSISSTCSKHGNINTRSGYDNELPDMHTLFVARGPSFASNPPVEAMSLTDVYPLICRILRIKPKANNGSVDIGKQLLATKTSVVKKVESNNVDESVKTSEKSGKKSSGGASISGGGIFLILLGSIVFSGSLFALREYFRRQKAPKGYRLMEHGFEPDLSLRGEPLLGNDSLTYRCPESMQMSIMSESGRGLSLREEEDDDAPPGTFSI